jgi:hypothetical protein
MAVNADNGYMTTTTTTAPAVSARHLTLVLEDPERVIVWLSAIDDVDVAEMTEKHKAEPSIKVLLDYEEALDLLLTAAGDVDGAAAMATEIVARQAAAGLL